MNIIDDGAIAALHYFSHGLPRLISTLGEMSLLQAFVDDAKTVEFETVVDVVRERQAAGGLSAFAQVPADLSNAGVRRLVLSEHSTERITLAVPRWVGATEG